MIPKFSVQGKPNYYKTAKGTMVTNEGVSAVNEAITFCQNAAAVPALQWDQYLGFAAMDLANEQGPTTQTGHTGPNGSTMRTRIETYG